MPPETEPPERKRMYMKQMYVNSSAGKTGKPACPDLLHSATAALLISLCFGSQCLALPFGKAKDAASDDEALISIPKVKLDKEQQNEFDASLKNGQAYLNANSIELALICFNRCVTLNPSSADAQIGLAYCDLALHKSMEAQQKVFEALRCDPSRTDARFLLGQIMMSDQRWDEAGGQFLQVLKLRPDDLGARGNLATCLQMMGQLDAAGGQYKYILEKDPKNAQAAYNLAAAYETKSMLDDAAVYYKKVVEIDPNNANAYCSLAKCLIAKKNFKSAQILLSHAGKIAPNNYYVHLNQGFLNEVQGDKRAAIEEFTRAVALAPQDPDSQKALHRMLETSAANRINARKGPSFSQISGLSVDTH
jgi:tetratricopeptide (TPR) repeat protein